MKKQNKIPQYGDIPEVFSEYTRALMVILPVPFDETSTWGKGADRGPNAIIEASAHMELYDIETKSEVFQKGIFTANALRDETPEGMIKAVYGKISGFINDGKFAVTLGGEHTVCIGPIMAHSERTKDLSILHLDAHTDRREIYQGSKYNHACAMARVAELCPNIVSVGIRSMDISERERILENDVFLASNIMKEGDWIERVVERLMHNVYVTIDLDAFDPSIVPSTGTPEPGGLDWYQVTSLLKAVAEKRLICGFDVVELCPSDNRSSDFLAAKLIYKLLSYVFCGPSRS